MSSQFAFSFYASFEADATFWQEIKSKTFLHRLISWLNYYKISLLWVEHHPLEKSDWMLQGEKRGAVEAPAHCQQLPRWPSHIWLLYPVGFVSSRGNYQCHHQAKLHPGTGVQPLWMPVGLHPLYHSRTSHTASETTLGCCGQNVISCHPWPRRRHFAFQGSAQIKLHLQCWEGPLL